MFAVQLDRLVDRSSV